MEILPCPVFEWQKRFVEGREDVEDDPKSGTPHPSTTDVSEENVPGYACTASHTIPEVSLMVPSFSARCCVILS